MHGKILFNMKNLTREAIIERVRNAGVVGAGGAGFPAHIKMDCKVDTLIVNIAECEPLICKDKEIARQFPEHIIKGAHLVMQVTGAKEALFAIKRKYTDIVTLLKKHLSPPLSIAPLEDYYPAGDEVLLAFDIKGTVVPEGTLPLSKGILVSNAETLYNVSLAVEGEPVIEKFLTITGNVNSPFTVRLPIGTTLGDIFRHFRIPTDAMIPFMDGIMMGTIAEGPSTPIEKTTSGIVLLPADHPVVEKRRRSKAHDERIIKSACDQCSYCTEYCPRYLMGHRVEPHRIMRSLALSSHGDEFPDYAAGCVECGLCTLFACPEALSPDSIMKVARKRGAARKREQHRLVHPMREFRKVPAQRLMRRVALDGFDRPAPYTSHELSPPIVRIPLAQYSGESPKVIKKEGDQVSRGEQLVSPGVATRASSVHASITGIITNVSQEMITIQRKG